MKLIFVHGINQQGKSKQIILDDWVNVLKEAIRDSSILDGCEIAAPFYGDLLFDAMRSGRQRSTNEAIDPQELAFKNTIALEIAEYEKAKSSETPQALSEILSQSERAERGFPHNRTFIEIAQAIETVSPLRGRLALRFLEQAHAYITNQDIARLVDRTVHDVLKDAGSCVIVAHSLGTIVTYKVLRELGTSTNVRGFITLGSPLGIRTIKDGIGPRYEKPAGVSRWYNAHDPRDFVALGHKLKEGHYEGITEELVDIKNNDDDPHAISNEGYLTDRRVCEWILASLAR